MVKARYSRELHQIGWFLVNGIIGTLTKSSSTRFEDINTIGYEQLVEDHIFLYKPPPSMEVPFEIKGVPEILEKWKMNN
jgi:hypothetical protein